ncbi:hypothetical protein SALB1_2060 [Salinisphaera sp. LB1]|nr:hypothetical protein SALB1_2060 [Salinisphaera sp. LB1]
MSDAAFGAAIEGRVSRRAVAVRPARRTGFTLSGIALLDRVVDASRPQRGIVSRGNGPGLRPRARE